jgi:aminopeptidase C
MDLRQFQLLLWANGKKRLWETQRLATTPFSIAHFDPCLPQNLLALTALSKNQLGDVVYQASALQTDKQMFNIKIPFEGAPVTNQRSSGRCWIFAATNVFRVAIMKKHNLSSFELSQAYLFFWDKLEKANWFFEQIVDTAKEDLDGRLVQALLSDPVGDGGQWDMLSNLVAKYGLVCDPSVRCESDADSFIRSHKPCIQMH